MPEIKNPDYATSEQALGWKSPDPLQEDYTHSDTGQTYRIEGIAKAKDRKAIHDEIARLRPLAETLAAQIGYKPDDSDVVDACWVAACVKIPQMTAFQWLQFGAEASLGELSTRCLIASRILEDKKHDDIQAQVPDGVVAAKAELEAEAEKDPLDSAGEDTAKNS